MCQLWRCVAANPQARDGTGRYGRRLSLSQEGARCHDRRQPLSRPADRTDRWTQTREKEPIG
ncbi:hypothetical protein GCM10011583_24900 [Streptomyces camponoticapitis]|uniref:Uncharacterized protein n=1 Tax=Streptomyces camponoticapitis TaxID=1616125 RepID=A0ABQ2E7K1_9ACTN|nr:hypothetical protein GCM10011583_24900 [Streptomyces camponoticapitis]